MNDKEIATRIRRLEALLRSLTTHVTKLGVKLDTLVNEGEDPSAEQSDASVDILAEQMLVEKVARQNLDSIIPYK